METDKVRTTVYVSGEKVELAKKRGYKCKQYYRRSIGYNIKYI